MANIKFYSNYNSKEKKFFISGKNEKNVYYSLWKSKEFNTDLYFDNDKFKKGCEIDKSKLKLLPREDGEESKVLVFKLAEDEKQYCISKEEIESRKKNKTNTYVDFIMPLFIDLFNSNPTLTISDEMSSKINDFKNKEKQEF